jgi:hypothetical protein
VFINKILQGFIKKKCQNKVPFFLFCKNWQKISTKGKEFMTKYFFWIVEVKILQKFITKITCSLFPY